MLDAAGGNAVIARDAGGWASAATVEEVYGHADVHDPLFAAALTGSGGRSRDPLALLPGHDGDRRVGRDRLELLTALINAPGFDPLYRSELIAFPPQHPVYAWQCTVQGCERIRQMGQTLCGTHYLLWEQAEAAGASRAGFMEAAQPLEAARGTDYGRCRICPERPAITPSLRLCNQHHNRWQHGSAAALGIEDLERWVAAQARCRDSAVQGPLPFLAVQLIGPVYSARVAVPDTGPPRRGAAMTSTRGAPGRPGAPGGLRRQEVFRTWCDGRCRSPSRGW